MLGKRITRYAGEPRETIMEQDKQQNAFAQDLAKLIDRYALEFNLTYASIIGCLELQKGELVKEVIDED